MKPKFQHDKGCEHRNRYRYRLGNGDTACAICRITRLMKDRDRYSMAIQAYHRLRQYAPNNLEPGTKVTLWFMGAGWPHDQQQLHDLGMQPGQTFTIERTDEGESATTFYLKEFPGKGFNSVNFSL